LAARRRIDLTAAQSRMTLSPEFLIARNGNAGNNSAATSGQSEKRLLNHGRLCGSPLKRERERESNAHFGLSSIFHYGSRIVRFVEGIANVVSSICTVLLDLDESFSSFDGSLRSSIRCVCLKA